MRQVADIPDGLTGSGCIVCGDADCDSMPDYTYFRSLPNHTWLWCFREYVPPSSFELVESETCVGPYPDTGIHKGAFLPTDLGDVDEDGLQEVLGYNTWYFTDSVHELVCLYEQPPGLLPDSYPDTLVWYYSYGNAGAGAWSWLPGDMDRDGRKEIVSSDGWHTYVFGGNFGDIILDRYRHSVGSIRKCARARQDRCEECILGGHPESVSSSIASGRPTAARWSASATRLR